MSEFARLSCLMDRMVAAVKAHEAAREASNLADDAASTVDPRGDRGMSEFARLSCLMDRMVAAVKAHEAAREASNLADDAASTASNALIATREKLQAELENLVKQRKGDTA